MPPADQPRKNSGPLELAFTLLFITPSALALFASHSLVNHSFPSVSALWLFYEISFYVGIVGIVLGVALIIGGMVGHSITPVFLWLMAIAVSCAIFFEWYATRIFRNPWTS